MAADSQAGPDRFDARGVGERNAAPDRRRAGGVAPYNHCLT